MIMNFDKGVAEILKILGITPSTISSDDLLKLSVVCFKQFDNGVAWERDRVIPIIQRLAIDPMRIVKEIRKPIR